MKSILTLLFIVLSAPIVFAQDVANAILGTWKNGEETGKPKLDKRNPDKSKRTVPTLGLVNLHGFTYDPKDKEWNGFIYDPKNGKEYDCRAELKDANTLKVRGYIGISLIGRTDTWTRLK